MYLKDGIDKALAVASITFEGIIPRGAGDADVADTGTVDVLMPADDGSFGDQALALGTDQLARIRGRSLKYWFFGDAPIVKAAGLRNIGDVSQSLAIKASLLRDGGQVGSRDVIVMGADTIAGDYEHRYLAARIQALNRAVERGHSGKLVNFSMPPAPSKTALRLLRKVHPDVHFWARDTESQTRSVEYLQREIQTCPDVASLMDPDQRGQSADQLRQRGDVPFIVFVPNAHFVTHFGRDQARLMAGWSEVIRSLRELAPVVVMPHDIRKRPGDVDMARQLAATSGVEIIEPATAPEAKFILASASLCVSARMHACVGALSSGTPCVGLEYLGKFAGQLAWYGEIGQTVSEVDATNKRVITDLAKHLMGHRQSASDPGALFAASWL